MIQRIQSLYLLIVSVLQLLIYFKGLHLSPIEVVELTAVVNFVLDDHRTCMVCHTLIQIPSFTMEINFRRAHFDAL